MKRIIKKDTIEVNYGSQTFIYSINDYRGTILEYRNRIKIIKKILDKI